MAKGTTDKHYHGKSKIKGKAAKVSDNRLSLISAVVIVTGIIMLVWINSSNSQDTEGAFIETAKIQSTQTSQNTAVFSTTAGAADILETDLLQVVLKATAGVADVLDEEFMADTHTASIQDKDTEESEYSNLAIAKVDNYVNVRSAPGTDSEVVGKMYDGSVAQILSTAGENNEWFQVVSGNVEGYIKAEYFIYGDAAVSVIDDYVTHYVVVQADR